MRVQTEVILDGNCSFDLERGVLTRGGLRIHLSRSQFLIMSRLAKSLGQPVSTSDLMISVWGYTNIHVRGALYVCINRLRKHLDDDGRQPQLLQSIKGHGYVLQSRT